ncbi:MAG: hypothetical protein OEY18_13865 [Candidatus Aminicenantes bacterium]|nr:hypothetical protein [Candidatus Aminicenantes bacterium]
MLKKKITCMLLAILVIFSFAVVNAEDKDSHTDLSSLLKKAAEYCKRLEHTSLYFVCMEEVKERIYYLNRPGRVGLRPTRFFNENKYLYDYQLIRKGSQITERRILLEENGKEKNEEDAQLKMQMFDHKYVIFGPIGLLSERWQQDHDYKIIGEKKLKDEHVLIVEATPKSSTDIDQLFGKIWIRKSDSSILKIEWNQTSMGNFDKIKEISKELNAQPDITFISEYDFEEKGIRFPSKYFVREEYVHSWLGRFRRSETTVTYKDYKFFTVETDVEFKK